MSDLVLSCPRLAAGLLLSLAGLSALAGPGPANTRVDADGRPLAAAAVDPHYRISYSAAFGTQAYAVPPQNAGDVDGPASSWLAPVPQGSFGADPARDGLVTWRTEFELDAADAGRLRIHGRWAADEQGLAIRLNGVAVAGVPAGSPQTWREFRIERGFVAGRNVLEFDTLSAAPSSGLRVEMRSELPGSGSEALMLGALGMTALRRRGGSVA
jgi:hypothetical protein